eukprot:GHUV01041081.1.p1 GENE.GHUV01041081.1~~GHUV01041081.1.p1  ORF type:complete len:103 (-),score=18.31 GHUV01041081.1:77-385(-)
MSFLPCDACLGQHTRPQVSITVMDWNHRCHEVTQYAQLWGVICCLTGTVFPLAWSPKDNTVPGIDVTQAYIDADIPPPSSAAVHSEVTAAPAAEMQQQVVVS